MKVFGHPMSTCTRKVLTTLHETATPFELVMVDFAKGEHKQPAHLARHPWGRIPALEDDGLSLIESRAICRYINERARGSLAPADVRGRALMEQWMSIETSYFTGPAMKLIYQHVFRFPQEAAVLEAAQRDLDVTLPILDAHLAAQPYFAGDTFSLADICFMPYVDYGMMTPLKEAISQHTHFRAWWGRVSERPSWRKVTGRS
jgi:glutathione S-transferase